MRAPRRTAPRRSAAATRRLAAAVMNASSLRRMRPFSAPVTSMTASSIASRSCVDLVHRHQLLAELVELAEAGELLVGDVELRLARCAGAAAPSAAWRPRPGDVRGSSNMLNASSTSPSVSRSPWTSRARRFFLPLMRISACLSTSSRLKSRPSKSTWACVSASPSPATATSLPSARPTVVTGLWRTNARGWTLGRKPLEDGHRRSEPGALAWTSARPSGVAPSRQREKLSKQSTPKRRSAVDLGAGTKRVRLHAIDDSAQLRHKRPRPRPFARGPFGGEDDHEENRNCRASCDRGGGWGPRGLRRRHAGAGQPRHQRIVGGPRRFVVCRAGDEQVVDGKT